MPSRDPLAAVHAEIGASIIYISTYARAANDRRCCGHGPWTWTALVCSGVMYPTCEQNPYRG